MKKARSMKVGRAAACSALLLAAGLAGCGGGKGAAGKVDEPAPTLAQQLDAMPAARQLEYLRELQRVEPGDAAVAFHIGNAYYSIASSYPAEERSQAVAYYDSAVAEYTRAVLIDSTYSKAFVNMALAFDAQGKRTDARLALEQAIAVNPTDVLAHCHLGLLQASAGDYDAAMRLYQRALALDPNSAQAHYNLGLAFAEKKVFAEALAEWEQVIALDPDGELGKTAAENVRIIRSRMEAKSQR